MYRFIILTLFLSACASTNVPLECPLVRGDSSQPIVQTNSHSDDFRHADVTTSQQNGIKSATIVIN